MLDAVPPVTLVARAGEMHLLSVLAAAENRSLETNRALRVQLRKVTDRFEFHLFHRH